MKIEKYNEQSQYKYTEKPKTGNVQTQPQGQVSADKQGGTPLVKKESTPQINTQDKVSFSQDGYSDIKKSQSQVTSSEKINETPVSQHKNEVSESEGKGNGKSHAPGQLKKEGEVGKSDGEERISEAGGKGKGKSHAPGQLKKEVEVSKAETEEPVAEAGGKGKGKGKGHAPGQLKKQGETDNGKGETAPGHLKKEAEKSESSVSKVLTEQDSPKETDASKEEKPTNTDGSPADKEQTNVPKEQPASTDNTSGSPAGQSEGVTVSGDGMTVSKETSGISGEQTSTQQDGVNKENTGLNTASAESAERTSEFKVSEQVGEITTGDKLLLTGEEEPSQFNVSQEQVQDINESFEGRLGSFKNALEELGLMGSYQDIKMKKMGNEEAVSMAFSGDAAGINQRINKVKEMGELNRAKINTLVEESGFKIDEVNDEHSKHMIDETRKNVANTLNPEEIQKSLIKGEKSLAGSVDDTVRKTVSEYMYAVGKDDEMHQNGEYEGKNIKSDSYFHDKSIKKV